VFGTAYTFRTGKGPDREAIIWGMPTGTWEGILDRYFAIACRSDPPLCSSAVAVNKRALLSIGCFPEGVDQGEDLLTWARLAAQYRVAYSMVVSAVFWHPEFDSGRPTRRPSSDDPVGDGLRLLMCDVGADHAADLRRYIGVWHQMRGVTFLRCGEGPAASHEFSVAFRLCGFSPRLVVCALLARLPASIGPALSRWARWVVRVTHTSVGG